MAITAEPEFMDGFDALSAAQITRKWTTGSCTVFSPGRSGIANSQEIQVTLGSTLRRAVTSANTGILQFAWKSPDAFPLGDINICSFFNSAGPQAGQQCVLSCTSAGFLKLVNGQTLAVIAVATNPLQTIVVGTRYIIEFACVTNQTTGTADVKVNGQAITGLFGLTGKATSGSSNAYDAIEIIGTSGTTGHRFDDVYFRTGSGGYNNASDFLGDIVIETVYPDATSSDAGHNQGTIYGGVVNRFQGIDEINASNDETDGVDLTTNGQKLYTSFGSLVGPAGATISTIHGVQINIIARKTDPGFSHALTPGTFKVGTPGTDYLGTSQSLQDTFTDKRKAWATRPDGSGAWTTTDIATGWEWGCQRDS